MRLILTHEQADFDALGALFGAGLAHEPALAVLPRKLNRNVRAFLALYGEEFPFLDARDLSGRSLDSVILVDTQSLVTHKGMKKDLAVQVIDHHARREATPASWEFTHLETGATTTYFVEALARRDETLSTAQATLLLLGVYEDTGSLTYPDTTVRDVRAAAWLLEAGASLRLAAEYLNPPLSDEQRRAYEALVLSSQTIAVDGLDVVIAQADLPALSDEISAIAHKLRDAVDADALFVLARIDEGVRVVARSTSDRLDVSAVLGEFGGGGHDRAASALIRDATVHAPQIVTESGVQTVLETTRRRLVSILPAHIRPAVTVSQLMSGLPRTLNPNTSAREAAGLMRRLGFEGFPVVEDGHVVGLLTRRAVDRAISHRLNLSAGSLMEAGEVTLHPTDSVQRLQTVMAKTGWGQIPVVNGSGSIVGIVTRTDLLRMLAPSPGQFARRNLRVELQEKLPAPQLTILQAVASEAAELHIPVYIVGGFVRDFLSSRPSIDFDIVTEGDAIVLARALKKAHGGSVTVHERFGTAKWFLRHSGPEQADSQTNTPLGLSSLLDSVPSSIDLITARLEFYQHPAALPGVEQGSIRHDLHRRDFTINTLAIRLDGHHFGELHDYYGGGDDLRHGVVRVLHSLSFVDDPTRLIRAVRYEQRYGFAIEKRTLQLMSEAHPLLGRLSPERVRHELDSVIDEVQAPLMLSRLSELGLLRSVSEELPWSPELEERLELGLAEPMPSKWGLSTGSYGAPLRRVLGYALWLQDLQPVELESLNSRLEFPSAVLKVVQGAAHLKARLPQLVLGPRSVWAFQLDSLPLISTYAVFLALPRSESDIRAALESYSIEWRHFRPATSGAALADLGIPPGPSYKTILTRLRAAWLDGEVSSEEQERDLLSQIVASELGSRPEGR